MNALEQYRTWKNQKNQIVGSLLEELSVQVNAAVEMEGIFTAEELKTFKQFDEFLFEVRSSYPSSGSPTLPHTTTPRVSKPAKVEGEKRGITYSWEEGKGSRCEASTGAGEQCRKTAKPDSRFCGRHSGYVGVVPTELQTSD